MNNGQDMNDVKVIAPRVELLTPIDGHAIIRKLELCARTCYKSEDRINEDSGRKLLSALLARTPAHESVLEHESITVRFVGDRSMSHQLVRHRIAAYSQESQRYCNYNKSAELEVVCPPSIHETSNRPGKYHVYTAWEQSVREAYYRYQYLIKDGIPPEDARSVLPNCAKTEVVTTYNVRQWRHFFRIRTDGHAQWQIRRLALTALMRFRERVPVLFDDVGPHAIDKAQVYEIRDAARP